MIAAHAVQEKARCSKELTPDRKHQNPAAVALQAKFNQGVALHQQGKLAEAERIYEEVLRQQPNHFDALHLLGIIALQTRRTERAVELIRKAIELNAKVAAAHSNLGNALTGPEASRRRAGELRQGDRAEARLCRGVQQPRQCAEGPEASRGRAGELRQGDRAEARLCRGVQQPWQCADGPEASRGRAGELRQGDCAEARLCRGVQQPRQCAEGPEASRGGAGELRQGDRAEARLCRGIQQPRQCADWT